MAHQHFFEYQPTKNLNRILREYGVTCLSDTTPAAPGGFTNITWQTDSRGNISAYHGGGGSGIDLQTNGVDNGSQTKLNLQAGTDVTLVDNGTGTVTINATGGGGSSIELQTDGVDNGSQTKLNLQAGANVSLVDNGTGTVTITAASAGGITPGPQFQIPAYSTGGTHSQNTNISTEASGNNLTVPGLNTTFQDNSTGFYIDPAGGPISDINTTFNQRNTVGTVYGPGFDLGGFGGWTGAFLSTNDLTVARRGITQIHGNQIFKRAIGDLAASYTYVHHDGGATASSDEGVSGLSLQVLESCQLNTYFHGTVASTTGHGDMSPVLAYGHGNNWVTDGAFLLNISKGQISGNMNGNGDGAGNASFTTNSGYSSFLPFTSCPLLLSLYRTQLGLLSRRITPDNWSVQVE